MFFEKRLSLKSRVYREPHGMGVKSEYLRGISTIRFLCALWVVVGHVGNAPLTDHFDKSTTIGFVVHGFYNSLISGPAAVIVFFIISGVCIHMPHARDNRIPSIGHYLIRRYVRIALPLIIAIVLAEFVFDVNLTLFGDSILWSLFAELVYYTIYPIVLYLRRAGVPWTYLVAMALAEALIVAASNPTAGNYPSYGLSANWLLGLPCWITGCLVAEHIHRFRATPPSRATIWSLRLSVLALSALCMVLRFHTAIGYPWSLNLFALVAGYWILMEIRFSDVHSPPAILEWAGSWSYSLYLVHLLAHVFFIRMLFPDNDRLVNWLVQMMFILLFSYVFARLFEFPSHRLARSLARQAPTPIHQS